MTTSWMSRNRYGDCFCWLDGGISGIARKNGQKQRISAIRGEAHWICGAFDSEALSFSCSGYCWRRREFEGMVFLIYKVLLRTWV
jgi:hypothetical protein